MNEIEELFKKSLKLNYPETMKCVEGEVKRTSFFPGGNGTIKNCKFPYNGIMIIGQDWGNEKGFEEAKKQKDGEELKNPTWKYLLTFLYELNIKRDECFYTNAIMGVRKGDKKPTGKSPAFKDSMFIKECQNFFLYQIEIQKPRAIFVLGLRVAEFLSETSDELKDWKNIKNFKSIDKLPDGSIGSFKKNIKFKNEIESNLVLLLHPSYRLRNMAFRECLPYNAKDKEIELTKKIL